MTIQQEEIRNVAKIFEAFARAVVKKENIKIEYLDEEGETIDFTIELNPDTPMIYFSLNLSGYIDIYKGVSVFHQNVNNIQSVTTFRTTKLKFHEVNKK